MTQGQRSGGDLDADARSLMRDRAARRGVTLGHETLQKIEPIEFSGWNEQDDVRRLSVELDRLSQKLESSQQRVARNVGAIDKAIVTMMSKVEQSGLAQVGALERVNRVVGELKNAQVALQQRIETMETESRTGPGLNALKDLEAALARLSDNVRQTPTSEDLRELEEGLAQLAESVQARHFAQEREQAGIRELVEGRVSEVSSRVDGLSRNLDAAISNALQSSNAGLSERVQQLEASAAQAERRVDTALGRMTDTAARMELLESKAERTIGDATWRMERAVDASLSRARTVTKDLTDRVDLIEGKTRDAVNAMSDAVSRIVDRIGRVESGQDTAVKALDRSLSALEERVARTGGEAAQEFERLQTGLQQRMDTLNGELSRSIHTIRLDVEQRLEQAARSNQPEKLERLERLVRALQEKLGESESRQADAVEEMSLHMERMARAVEDRLKSVESRDPGKSVDEVRRELSQLADRIESRVSSMEADARAANVNFQSLRGELGRVGTQAEERIRDLDQRSARALEGLGEQVSEVAERMHRRHEDDMRTAVERMQEHVRESNRASSDELARLSGKVEELADRDEHAAAGYQTIVQRIDERVRDSERRSADAIGQIGEQVARAAERLQAQQSDALKSLNEKLGESGRQHETRLSEALADMGRRMEEIGEQSSAALAPINTTMASLARRMSMIEDEGLPAGTRPDAFAGDPAPPDFTSDLAFEPRSPAGEVFDLDAATDTPDVIGVEPPPYDNSADAHLFVEGPTAQAAKAPPLGPVLDRTDAVSVEDLLEIDDMLLDARPAEPARSHSASQEFVADLPGALASGRSGSRYLDEARRAAQTSNRFIPGDFDASGTKRGLGRGPLVASAAIAIAVAGGGVYTMMRGKQDVTPDPAVRSDPAAPTQAEGDSKSAAAVLFGDDGAATIETAAGLRPSGAGADASGASDDLFGVSDAAEPAASGEGALTPITLAEAVKDGDPVALYDQAIELLQTGEKGRGVALMKDAAGRGLVVAKYRLGKLYESGEGVPRDMAQARNWTEQAAIAGNVKAMHDLAVFYAEGDAGPQSYAAAVEWFRQASELGLVDSQYNLAVLFEQGLGVSMDKAEAAFWFEVAGRAGDQDAAKRARGLFAELGVDDGDVVKRRARAYNPKAPNPRANGALGQRPWEILSTAQAAEMQRILARLGYNPGGSDGRLGDQTKLAIRAFERDFGLPPTGDATVSNLRKMRAADLNTN
jgi:localization factor PodJL